MHARSEVALLLPQGCAAETPQDKIIIRVVPGVLYRKIS